MAEPCAASTADNLSAVEIGVLLRTARSGDVVERGAATSRRVSRSLELTLGSTAGAVWAVNVWMMFIHAR